MGSSGTAAKKQNIDHEVSRLLVLADESTRAHRLSVCQACPHLVEPPAHGVHPLIEKGAKVDFCALTGTAVSAMARLASGTCPDPDPANPGRSRWGDPLAA